MVYKVVPIPGGSTRYDDAPKVEVSGGGGSSATVVITYAAGLEMENGSQTYGELKFFEVFEYKWVWQDISYHIEDRDFEFGLIEIINSPHIEEMASTGGARDYPGRRFVPGVRESDVKHYRLGFDDCGTFDIVALGVEARLIPG